MRKTLRTSRGALSIFLCVTLLAVGLISAIPATADAKMIEKAPAAQSICMEDVASSPSAVDLDNLSAGLDETTMWYIILGAAVVAACVVVAIIIW